MEEVASSDESGARGTSGEEERPRRRSRRPCAGRPWRRRARRRRPWCRRRSCRRGRRGWIRGRSRSDRGSTWKATGSPRRERRMAEVESMRLEEAMSNPAEEVAARRSSRRGREGRRSGRRDGRGGAGRRGAGGAGGGCVRWSRCRSLRGRPVEEDGDDHPAGEDEASAGGVQAQGEEFEVGLLGVALEGGLEDAGLEPGVQAPGEGRGATVRNAGWTVPSRSETAWGAPARGGTRPSKLTRSSAETDWTRAPSPTTASVQVRRAGRVGIRARRGRRSRGRRAGGEPSSRRSE